MKEGVDPGDDDEVLMPLQKITYSVVKDDKGIGGYGRNRLMDA